MRRSLTALLFLSPSRRLTVVPPPEGQSRVRRDGVYPKRSSTAARPFLDRQLPKGLDPVALGTRSASERDIVADACGGGEAERLRKSPELNCKASLDGGIRVEGVSAMVWT